jgi:phosphoribosyl 1,2-cyclic phosphodiesterase
LAAQNSVRSTQNIAKHSIRAPCVGYLVSAKSTSLFYLPDAAKLPNPAQALRDISVFGDGATLRRPIIREKCGMLVGHASITTQLDWCDRAHVNKAVFTHCSSPIVRGDARVFSAMVCSLGRKHGMEASLACDGRSTIPFAAARA